MNPEHQNSPINEDLMLMKWFTSILNDSVANISEDDLYTFLKIDVKFTDDELKWGLLILPTMLTVYMQDWKGWTSIEDYRAGKLTKEDYFQKFKTYIKYKINRCIEDYTAILSEFKANNPCNKYLDIQTHTEPKLTPYTLLVKCTSQMMNSIVFTTDGDDVILKHHVVNSWKPLSTTQLIMWPNITVTYVSSDLSFTRSNATEYKRYINLLPLNCKNFKGPVVESAENIKPTVQRHVYSFFLIGAYVKEYMKKLKHSNCLDSDQLEEIETVLFHFLEDIKTIDQGKSIATNTKVLFRPSQATFVRNKKLAQEQHSHKDSTRARRVGYCEVIIPKTELLLTEFKAQQLPTTEIKFESLEEVSGSRLVSPKICYKCDICHSNFVAEFGKNEILTHLMKEHKMEQYVHCTQCNKSFDILDLTVCRWRHQCDT